MNISRQVFMYMNYRCRVWFFVIIIIIAIVNLIIYFLVYPHIMTNRTPWNSLWTRYFNPIPAIDFLYSSLLLSIKYRFHLEYIQRSITIRTFATTLFACTYIYFTSYYNTRHNTHLTHNFLLSI